MKNMIRFPAVPFCRLLAVELLKISYAGVLGRSLGLIETSSAASPVEIVGLDWDTPKLSASQLKRSFKDP